MRFSLRTLCTMSCITSLAIGLCIQRHQLSVAERALDESKAELRTARINVERSGAKVYVTWTAIDGRQQTMQMLDGQIGEIGPLWQQDGKPK